MKKTSSRLLLIGLNTLIGATASFAQTPITDLEATGTTKIEGPLQIDDTGTGAAPGLWYVENMHEGFYFFDDPFATDQFVPDFQGGERVFFWHPDKMALRMGTAGASNFDDTSIGEYSIAFGLDAMAVGEHSMAIGDFAHANGDYSFAQGRTSTANGDYSISLGFTSLASGMQSVAISSGLATGINSVSLGGTMASGDNSVAISIGSVASGDLSIALGVAAAANGTASVALGLQNQADSAFSVALGSRNIGGGDAEQWIETDPLLELGNGLPGETGYDSNAILVRKNGQTTLDNKFWDEQNPVVVPTSTDASQGEALVVNGHARLRGVVVLEQAQGDISMGSFQ